MAVRFQNKVRMTTYGSHRLRSMINGKRPLGMYMRHPYRKDDMIFAKCYKNPFLSHIRMYGE